jgi:AraC-like DNA-binding protein
MTGLRFTFRLHKLANAAVSFADLSNFNRGFRQRYGVTPSDVRPKAKAGCQPIRKIEG